MNHADDARGLIEALIDDGRPLLKLMALALIGAGLFAFFLGATGHFLPHDISHLGMTTDELRSIADSRLVYFMIHDRVSFGGAIIAVGSLYLWLAEFPLRSGHGWAWWTFLVSGTVFIADAASPAGPFLELSGVDSQNQIVAQSIAGRVVNRDEKPVANAAVSTFWRANGSSRQPDGTPFDLSDAKQLREFWGRLGPMAPQESAVRAETAYP